MFPIRTTITLDVCSRIGCDREPEVVLDKSSRLSDEFKRNRVPLCMACLAEAEAKLRNRQHAERLERAAHMEVTERTRNPGGYR